MQGIRIRLGQIDFKRNFINDKNINMNDYFQIESDQIANNIKRTIVISRFVILKNRSE